MYYYIKFADGYVCEREVEYSFEFNADVLIRKHGAIVFLKIIY